MTVDDDVRPGVVSRRELLRRGGRLAAIGGGLPFAAELLAACGSSGSGDSSGGGTPARTGGTVVEGNVADPTTFNPLVGQDFTAYIVTGLCFDGLLSVDAKGVAAPAVAAELPTVSDGGKKYVFKLRDGVKWSDGKPLTADDVVFTYDLMHAPKYKAFASAYRGDMETHLKSVRAIDDMTVEFVTTTAYAPFVVAFCTLGLLPKHVLGSLTGEQMNKADFNLNPTVTNGVFKLVKWDKGSQIRFTRNPDYYRGPAKVENYVIKIVASPVSIVQQLRTGELDVGPVDADQYESLKSSGSVDLVTFPSLTVEVATFQLNSNVPSSKFFAEKEVRQALWWALDRQQIIDSVFFKTGGALTNSPEPVGTWAHSDAVTPNYTHDPERANALLDQLGWKRNGSGVRERNGVTAKFTILTKTGSTLVPAIQAMAAQWKEIGVQAATRGVTIGVIIDQLFKTRSFDMIVIGNNLLSADPDMSAYYHSRSAAPGGLNGGGYKNPKMDAILDKAIATLDQDERKALYAEFQNIFADDPPGIPVVSLTGAYGVTKRVQGENFNTYNQYTPRPFLDNVTVNS